MGWKSITGLPVAFRRYLFICVDTGTVRVKKVKRGTVRVKCLRQVRMRLMASRAKLTRWDELRTEARFTSLHFLFFAARGHFYTNGIYIDFKLCLLYTSDAADE